MAVQLPVRGKSGAYCFAEYVTEGTIVETFKAMVEKMFNGAATAKGALIIIPSKVIVTTPGAENKKEI